MLITDMENLSQFYQLRHMTEPCIVKYMACSLQTQHKVYYCSSQRLMCQEVFFIFVESGRNKYYLPRPMKCWIYRLQAMYFTMHGSVICLN